MKYSIAIWIFLLMLATSCMSDSTDEQRTHEQPSPQDSAMADDDHAHPDTVDLFSNDRFRDVSVVRTGDSSFEISGKAQVFEAAYSWVVEDTQNEIKKGFGTTDAGAPAWGNFSFPLTVAKRDSNSLLQLILFEASAKDGSRQHELPIVLY